MRRFVGLVPVLLLSVATAISAVIGLSLSHGATRSIADELGCQEVRSSHPQAGVNKETCSYHGGTIVVILTLNKGPHALYPPVLPDTFIIGSSGKATAWVVGCQRRDDCVTIKRQLGGELTSGPMLGLSLVVG